jgi:GxGYxYP putative glycoside hydrolase C-terminal domain/GxGYxYP_N 1st domain/GxGYxYP_N second domain/GxGYxYP third domain
MKRFVLIAIALSFAILSITSCAKNENPVEPGAPADDGPAIGDARSNRAEWTSVFPRATAAPQHLYVYDARADNYEMLIFLTSLQGVVNKTEPRIYMIHTSEVDPFWLNEMEEDYGVTSETVADPWALLDLFIEEISGLIVYDPDLLASTDLAGTMAGLNSAVVVAPSLLAQAQAHGLDILEDMDLRGRFAHRVEMFTWAMENVWPLANQDIICFLNPVVYTSRDYLIANNILTLMLDMHIPEERALLEDVLAQTPANIPIIGWAIDELLGVIIFSEGNKFHVATDGARNMSVTSGLPFPELTQDHAGEFGAVENKTYISFAYTDGDNVAYSLDAMWHKWQDPARGEIPLGWEISFNLVDLGPMAIRYFYETRTENDMFIGPACGIGYIYPNRYEDLDTFVSMTRPYMEAADMDTIWLINDDLTLADDAVLAYTTGMDLSGIFIDYWANLDKGFYFASDGTPVLRSQYVYLIGPEQIPGIIETKKVEKDMLYPHSPFFLFIGVNGWATAPSYIKEIIDGLSDEYVVLRPDEMFAAMDKAYDDGWEF